MSKEVYAKEILKKCRMESYKSTSTPINLKEKFNKNDGTNKVDECLYRSLIGCLVYLLAIRSDIAFTVSLLSCCMHCASELYKDCKIYQRFNGIKFTHC